MTDPRYRFELRHNACGTAAKCAPTIPHPRSMILGVESHYCAQCRVKDGPRAFTWVDTQQQAVA